MTLLRLRQARPYGPPRTRGPYAALIAAGVLVGAVAGGLLRACLPESSAAPELAWADEFDGPPGRPDPDRWKLVDGHLGYNNEQDYYRPENAALDGRGHLVITARADNAHQFDCMPRLCAATSARLSTEDLFAVRYGRLEARIRVPSGRGLWPAFWARRVQPAGGRGEIDVMEILGHEPGVLHGSLHGGGGFDTTDTFRLPDGGSFAAGFHVFAVEWRRDGICFEVDGDLYACREKGRPAPGSWDFDRPFFLLLNLAVGGDWPRAPDVSTRFPASMVVDYVRVYGTG